MPAATPTPGAAPWDALAANPATPAAPVAAPTEPAIVAGNDAPPIADIEAASDEFTQQILDATAKRFAKERTGPFSTESRDLTVAPDPTALEAPDDELDDDAAAAHDAQQQMDLDHADAPVLEVTGPTSAPTYTIDGREFSEADFRALISTYQYVQSPNVAAVIDALSAGTHQLTPINSGPAPAAAPAPTPVAATPTYSPDDFEDPNVAAHLNAMEARHAADLARLESAAQVGISAGAEMANSRLQAEATRASLDFQTRYSLSDEEFSRVEQAAIAQRIPAAFAALHPNDPFTGITAALEATFGQPQFRDALVKARVDAELDRMQSNELAQQRIRKTNAAALAGSPQGSVPRATPVQQDARAMNDKQLRAATAEIIRAAGTG